MVWEKYKREDLNPCVRCIVMHKKFAFAFIAILLADPVSSAVGIVD